MYGSMSLELPFPRLWAGDRLVPKTWHHSIQEVLFPSHHGPFPAQYHSAWPHHSSLSSPLHPSPALMGSCEQRGGGVRAALGSQQPCHYSFARRFSLRSVLYPSHTRDRGLKQINKQRCTATCLLGSARLEASGSHCREWRVVASPEPFGGRLSSYPSHLRPQQ